MAEDRASIDGATILDNAAVRRVEFGGEVGGEWYDFAVHYAVLEALGGTAIDGTTDVLALFGRCRDEIALAAARALTRGPGTTDPVDIAEQDIL